MSALSASLGTGTSQENIEGRIMADSATCIHGDVCRFHLTFGMCRRCYLYEPKQETLEDITAKQTEEMNMIRGQLAYIMNKLEETRKAKKVSQYDWI